MPDDAYILAWNRSTGEGEIHPVDAFEDLDPNRYEADFVFDSKEEAQAYLEGQA